MGVRGYLTSIRHQHGTRDGDFYTCRVTLLNRSSPADGDGRKTWPRRVWNWAARHCRWDSRPLPTAICSSRAATVLRGILSLRSPKAATPVPVSIVALLPIRRICLHLPTTPANRGGDFTPRPPDSCDVMSPGKSGNDHQALDGFFLFLGSRNAKFFLSDAAFHTPVTGAKALIPRPVADRSGVGSCYGEYRQAV